MMLEIPLAASLRHASDSFSSWKEGYTPVAQVRLDGADEQWWSSMWPLEDTRCGLDLNRVSNRGTSPVAFDIVCFIVPKTGLSVCLPYYGLLAIRTRESNAVRPSVALKHVSMTSLCAGRGDEATC